MINYIQEMIYDQVKWLLYDLYNDTQTIVIIAAKPEAEYQIQIGLKRNGQAVYQNYNIYNMDFMVSNSLLSLYAELQAKIKDNPKDDIIQQLKDLIGKL